MINESYTSIFVKDIRVPVRIGLLEAEKKAPQTLIISVELQTSIDYLNAADNDTIIDYALIYNHIIQWQDKPHTDLLETLAKDLTEFCLSMNGVNAVRVTLAKPDIFSQAQQAGIDVYITKS